MWQGQLALAQQGWRVIAPHLRGFADGAGDPPTAAIDDYAADMIDLLDALHIEDAVVGGLSMGGYVAFAMFRHAPRYFQGLVLADTRAEADTPEGIAGRTRMLQMVEGKGAAGVAAVADDMVPKLLGETTRAQKPDVVQHVRSLILSNTSEAIAGGVRALMSRPDSTPLLKSIHCPTLVIVGEEDAVTPSALAERMHSAIAGSELVTIAAAGHLSNIEQPSAFNDALARFLTHRL